MRTSTTVIPAKAESRVPRGFSWIPAYAGMTSSVQGSCATLRNGASIAFGSELPDQRCTRNLDSWQRFPNAVDCAQVQRLLGPALRAHAGHRYAPADDHDFLPRFNACQYLAQTR